MKMEEVFELLCSHQKIQRDKGIDKLEKHFSCIESEKELSSSIERLMSLLLKYKSAPWETLHGSLMGVKCVIGHRKTSTIYLSEFIDDIQNICLQLLTHDESRVRLAAGQVLGALCSKFGLQIYNSVRDEVLRLIKDNIERDTQLDCSKEEDSYESSLYKLRRSSSSEIFHDTAGWKSLETSMTCLQYMVNGCGPSFQEMIDQNLLDLIFVALKHSNRFVRETAYYVFGSLVSCVSENKDDSQTLDKYGQQLCQHLAYGLADNWSQVRLAASEATRKFLLALPVEFNKDNYLQQLLPRMCLNRYYVAEGVRLYSQESWKLVAGNEGKELVEKFIVDVVNFYIDQTEADNHAVREAACACIAELSSKIRSEIVEPHVTELLKALLVCFQDDSWPVRDAACLASGNFILCFPEQSRSSMDRLYTFFYGNLNDNIASVRQGGAAALANVARAYANESLTILKDKIVEGLEGVQNQPAESYKESDSVNKLSQFGVIKQMRDNDVALHTNQPMFSCGSLAPKMGRGGGCMDHQFRRPSEPWELADGCVNLIAELSLVESAKSLVLELLPKLSGATAHKHYSHHVSLLETLCKQLPRVAKGVGKRPFKQHLECFLSSIFYALQVDNALTKLAAENCLLELSKYLGENILRGRVENHNPNYLDAYDRIVLLRF